MSAATVDAVCGCGNRAEAGSDLCEWCDAHADCVRPSTVRIGRAWLSGTPVAWCTVCGERSAYWECVCDLAHRCEVAA